MENPITAGLADALSYAEYRSLIAKLLSENQSTGHRQSEDLTHYSRMNEARMNRLEKTVTVSEENARKLRSIGSGFTWLVLSEGWCGDAAQILPILDKLARENDHITLQIVLRDDHPALMDLFLTNNTRSIPKLIILDEDLGVRAVWGPRPKGAVELVTDYKRRVGVFDDEGKTALQLWYTKDKGISIQNEIAAIMAAL
ncbi:thioredoxin family protein [Flavobacterium magnum]|uniref:Thioredoxin family protein n=1 Tax=Flavobacterium magnum TaxID=2162713 RepID=A0A2S0RBQ0_9FLAO|nr:thioredoxin family protein [Flavobacterium magnum]AWA28995.1 thioredoxin family protein [Flavobacterium magnum]